MWLRSDDDTKRPPPPSSLLDYHLMHLTVAGLDACVSKIHTELVYLLRHPTCKLGYWQRRASRRVHSSHFGWTEHQVASHIVSCLPRVDLQKRLEQIEQAEWKVGLYVMASLDGYADGSNLRIYIDPTIVDSAGLVRFLHRIFDHPSCRFLYRRFPSRSLYVPILAEALSVATWLTRRIATRGTNRVVGRADEIRGSVSASTQFVEILQADANIAMHTALVYHVIWSYYQSLECTEAERRHLDKRGLCICVHYTHDWDDLLDTTQLAGYGVVTLNFQTRQLDMPLRAFVRTAPRHLLPMQLQRRTSAPRPRHALSVAAADLNISIWPIAKSSLTDREETFQVTSNRVTLGRADASECVVVLLNGELHYSYSLQPTIPVLPHRLRGLLSFRSLP